MKRRFSIPYNGIDYDEYLSKIEPYKEYIENIYFAPPLTLLSHAIAKVNAKTDYDIYEKNSYELMKHNTQYKLIITMNNGFYRLNNQSLLEYKKKIKKIVKAGANGFILTEFTLLEVIHSIYPELELHTSCNCFQWNIHQMSIWKDAGISVFNPPREILRTPDKLKEMHDAGFKLKCIVNEGCLYGCPRTINHCMNIANGDAMIGMKNCILDNAVNVLRQNWVLPRWLPKLDEYVDIYKISGRNAEIDYIVSVLDYYINERNDIYLEDIVNGSSIGLIKKLHIPVNEIHDKLLTCECKECINCGLCDKLVNKYLK